MNQEGVKVLLLSKRPGGLLSLLRRLEQRGCRCWCATSSEEGLSLFDAHNFDLILSAGPLHQASPMITRLVESHCSVFYSYPVENGWWWIPLVDHGQKCLGAPALRPGEFVAMLDQMVPEIERNDVADAVAAGG